MKSFFDEFINVEPNQDGFIVYHKEGKFEFTNELFEEIEVIDSLVLEDLFFNYCQEKITHFSRTSSNKNVYAFVLYLDPCYGDVILYLNTTEALLEEINRKQREPWNIEWLKYHGIGDYRYMIHEELPEPLNQIMKLYLKIYDGQGKPKFHKDIAIKNEIFEDNLIAIGEKVINRLKPFSLLNKSSDFIGFVADHDNTYFLNTVDEEFYNKFVKLSYQ